MRNKGTKRTKSIHTNLLVFEYLTHFALMSHKAWNLLWNRLAFKFGDPASLLSDGITDKYHYICL